MNQEKENFDYVDYLKTVCAIVIMLFYVGAAFANTIDLQSKYIHINFFTTISCVIIGSFLALYFFALLYKIVTEENEKFGAKDEFRYSPVQVTVNGPLYDTVKGFLKTVKENTVFVTIQMILGCITFVIFVIFWLKYGSTTNDIFKWHFLNYAKLHQFQILLVSIAVPQSVALYYYCTVLFSQIFHKSSTERTNEETNMFSY